MEKQVYLAPGKRMHNFIPSESSSLIKTKLIEILIYRLKQGWATLFDSRAALETKLVGAGKNKCNKDLFDMTYEKKWAFSRPFSQKKRL